MSNPGAVSLSYQIRLRAAAKQVPMDHLKLQKLCFYGYGAALAYSVEHELGHITFEPWKHGPVNRDVWNTYREFRGDPIPAPNALSWDYQRAELRTVLDDVVEVYGRMSSWAIRCESHREQPWLFAMSERRPISYDEMRQHFQVKFAPYCVQLPTYLAGAANAAVDGIPRARFESLHAMAEALRKMAALRLTALAHG